VGADGAVFEILAHATSHGGRFGTGLEEDDFRLGRVVSVFHSGCAGDFFHLQRAVVVCDFDVLPSGTGTDLFDPDPAGAEDRGRITEAVNDGAFHADAAGPAVQDEVDAAVQVVVDVLRGRRGGSRRGVRGGSGEGSVGNMDEEACEGGGWDADAEGGQIGGDFLCQERTWWVREDNRQGTGPETRYQRLVYRGDQVRLGDRSSSGCRCAVRLLRGVGVEKPL